MNKSPRDPELAHQLHAQERVAPNLGPPEELDTLLSKDTTPTAKARPARFKPAHGLITRLLAPLSLEQLCPRGNEARRAAEL